MRVGVSALTPGAAQAFPVSRWAVSWDVVSDLDTDPRSCVQSQWTLGNRKPLPDAGVSMA